MRARLKVSRAGVELIKSFEGLRQTAARLPDGRWTLGYGHTFSARDGARVTPEDAEALLRFDLLPIVDGLNNNIVVPLNQYQFDALVSFCFNIGIENFLTSNVLKRINEGRLMEAALAMESWRSAEFGGQTYVLAPLIRRRAAEKNLFLTPVETDNTAPSMLVRPMEDPRLGQDGPASRPTELDAPLYGDRVQARPLGEPEYKSVPAHDTPVQAAPVAPVPNYGSDRSYIDLSASPMAPQTEMARAKPVIVRMADVAPEPQPLPVAAPATPYEAEPTMSPAVRAALEQAQAEADARVRAEEQRRADEIRMAEEARLREIRLAEEAQRQAQALAAARAEQEARQAQAEAALRLEAQRQEDLKREAEARQQAEAAAAELARSAAPVVSEVPTASEAPAAPVIEVKATPPVAEPVKAEDKPAEAAPAAMTPEEAKRAEAKANLMRFYSPYGASPMGKPLVPPKPIQPATQSTPSAAVAPPSVAQSGPVAAPAPATPVYPAYPPAKAPDTPPVIMNDAVSAAPGLLIDTQEPTILSPSALVPPAVFAATPQSVARPAEAPLEMSRSNPARQAAAEAQVSWRDKLERPLPGEFPKAGTQTAPYHSPSKVLEATTSDDDDLWDDEHARIAITVDHAEDDHPSLMSMVGSSIGWIISSVLGMVCLAGAAAAFYKSNDPISVRDGYYDFFLHMSIGLAVLGLVLICTSIAMILKRLGGLKD